MMHGVDHPEGGGMLLMLRGLKEMVVSVVVMARRRPAS
jgi:hypothetical protein